MFKARLCILLLAAALLGPAPALRAKTTWTGQVANTMPSQDNAIFFIEAVDGEHAWSVGKRNSGSGDEVVMQRTTNGTSWSQVQLPQSGSMFPLLPTALVFVDADRGYLAAGQLSGLSMQYTIYETTNGGGSWTEVYNPTGEILDFQVLSSGEILGVGSGGVERSADGQTWTNTALDAPADDVAPASIAMLNDTCGWLVGGLPADSDAGRPNPSQGAVWYTDDGGESWTVIAQGLAFYLRAASFVAGDVGWAVGQQNGATGVLALTTDGGATWSPVAVPDHPALPDVCLLSQCITDPTPVSDMTGIRFWDTARGIASGLACTGGCGAGEDPTYLTVFLRTYDGGATWAYDEDYEAAMPEVNLGMMTLPGQMSGLQSMAFPDPNHGFLAGELEMILRYDADFIEDPAQSEPACGSTVGDGGVGPGTDGGSTGTDGGGTPDDGDQLSGCGCRAGGGGAGTPVLFGWLLWMLWRRRRR